METVKRCWWKCSQWIMRDSDTDEDVHIKRVFTPVVLCVLPLSVYLLSYALQEGSAIYAAGSCTFLTVYVSWLGSGMLGGNMGITMDIELVLLTWANVLSDAYNSSALRQRTWSLIVCFLDLALVLDRTRAIPVMISVTLVWLFIINTESAFRFGLYDEISSAKPEVCDCAEPPCGVTLE
eukprot:Hpha_TRINITY_DN16030_c1_g5::TRINITY_DN16030_c1_g5_i1::g.120790::m.120790